jgi:hypothetical protein
MANLLLSLARDPTRERVSLRDILAAMQDRAVPALILMLALPNAVPAVPGTSALLGIPLTLLTLQLARGRGPWLPDSLLRLSLSKEQFTAAVLRAAPWLDRAELLLRPRLTPLTGRVATRSVGCLGVVLSVVLSLPIPLGNMLPAVAISLLALGLLERDGLCVLWGIVTAAIAMGLAGGVVYALSKVVLQVTGLAGR